MSKTRHIQIRMNQRAVDQEILELVLKFGVAQREGSVEKVMLTKKSIDKTIKHIDRLRAQFVRAKDRGGFVVVKNPDVDAEITIYRLDSYKRGPREVSA